MIIRKPFKFLIEHFKIINAILILLIGFVTFKLFNIMQFFSNFVSNNYTTLENDIAVHYIGTLLPIALIAIILINIIIFILFKSKDKDTKLYLISTAFFSVLLVFTFVYKGVLDNFEFNTIESQTALLYRDTSKFTFYPNFLFLIFYFLNFIGFDLITFEFTNLRDDIDIAQEDDAEIEIGVNLEDYKIKRGFHKKLRELKYYIVDNKLSVRETEKYVKNQLNRKKSKKDKVPAQDFSYLYREIEENFKYKLGSKTTIKSKDNDKGKIEIEFYSKEELEHIMELIYSINN